MKVSRQQAAENRERILDVAATLFRERGLDRVSVADLMKRAGLTHGGFYGHFASKEELIAEACGRAFAASTRKWASVCSGRDNVEPLSIIARSYLSARHRDDPGAGCAMAALASELPRRGSMLRRAATAGVSSLVDVLARTMPGRTLGARRSRALAAYASMVGGIVLARAVEDSQLSAEILKAVASSIEASST